MPKKTKRSKSKQEKPAPYDEFVTVSALRPGIWTSYEDEQADEDKRLREAFIAGGLQAVYELGYEDAGDY